MTLEFTDSFFVLECLSSCCSEDMQYSLFNPAHTQDWTGARLSDMPGCQTAPILTSALTDNLLLTLYLSCIYNHRSILFGYHLQLLVQGHQGNLNFHIRTVHLDIIKVLFIRQLIH